MKDEKEIAKKLYSSYKYGGGEVSDEELLTREYKIFRKKKTTADTLYEQLAQAAGKIIKVKVDPQKKAKIEEIFSNFDYVITAEDAVALSIAAPIALTIFGLAFIPLSIMLTVAMLAFAGFAYYYLSNYPQHLVEVRRVKSSTEIILAVLYMVIYMKNISNLEEAVRFAADNLEGPLALDFKKMLWDVSSKKYASIKEAFDDYLVQWKKYNPPFVDSIYLIETSLVQKNEERRIKLLDQALKRILDGTYEMMVHYVNGLRTPISAVFMLGITLPIMGLVMLPIIGAFLANIITPSSLFVFYDLLLPLVVVIMILQILSSRPAAFPQINLENHPLVPPKGYFYFFGKPVRIIIPTILVFIVLNIPFLMYLIMPRSPVPNEMDVIFSLFFVLALAFSIVTYAKLSTDIKVKLRKEIKGVESDFAYAVFQIANRLEEGVPAEIAMLKTAIVMKKSHVAKFIGVIANNMSKLGMDLKAAIFDKRVGAVNMYPSSLIRSVMRIFVESTKESEKVAAASLTHIAQYLQSVHRIEEKIKDVLSETLSTLKFQASFIAPIISGIIVGLTAMILSILAVLGEKISSIGSASAGAGVPASLGGAMSFGFFEMSNTIPLAMFQIIVGIYLVEIVIISAVLASKIEFGDDSIQELYTIKKLLMYAVIIYFFVAAGVTVAFGSMARTAIALGTFG
ncbi:MAG: hypothetical protein J7K73_03670 [Nanoarchaeota archaeon]|nr:hypothetical protein [Nanoarchaeota archaeon]